MDLVSTHLGSFSAVSNGELRRGLPGQHTATVRVAGTGAVSCTVVIRGGNNEAALATVATITATGTDSAVGTGGWGDDYRFWRADVTAISGTGAAVQVDCASDVDAGFDLKSRSGQDAVRGAALSAKGGRRGMRFPFGRYATLANDASGRTHHLVMDLPDGADELILVAVNNQTAQVVELQAMACAMANLNNINNSDGTAGAWSSTANWADNTGNTSIGRVPVSASTARMKYIMSDPIAISTPARTDGGRGSLVGIRFFIRTNIPTYTVFGNGGTDNLTNWASRTDGRTLIMRSQIGQHLIPTTGFNSTTNESQSPIAGVIFLARGQVVNVVRFGDSIMDGRGTYIGDGYIGPACVQASIDTGVAVCDSNLAWAGTTSATFSQIAKDFIAAFGNYIDLIAYPDGTPNDASGTAITDAIIASRRRRTSDVVDTAVRARIPVLLSTWAATNPAVNDWNASDSLRRETVVAAKTQRDVTVIDTDSVWSGALDGDGQAGMVAGTTSDNIHPNDAGNALAAPLATEAIKRFIRKLPA